MRKSYFIILFFIFFQIVFSKEYGINQLYNMVLKNNYDIKKSLNLINIANEKFNSAKSGYLPSLTLNSRFTRIGVIPEINIPGMEGIKFMTPNSFSSSLNLSYTLWDWGLRHEQMAIEKIGIKSEKINLEILKKNLKFKLIQSIMNLFMLEDTIDIFNENLKIMKSIETIVRKRYENGYIPEHQLLQIQLRIKDLESNLIDLVKKKKELYNNIKKVIGINEDFKVKRFVTNKNIFNLNPDDAMKIAKQKRVELKILYLQKEILSKTKKILKKSKYPMLSASLIGELKNGIMPDVEALKTNWNVSLNLFYNIFDGGKTKHDIKAVKYQIDSLNNSIDKMIFEIKLNLLKLFQQYQLVRKEYVLSKKKIEISDKALRLTRKSFDKLLANYLDVLNAQNNFLLTKSSYLNMKYALEFLNLSLRYEIGRDLMEISEVK